MAEKVTIIEILDSKFPSSSTPGTKLVPFGQSRIAAAADGNGGSPMFACKCKVGFYSLCHIGREKGHVEIM